MACRDLSPSGVLMAGGWWLVQGELTHVSENCPIQATQAIRARGGGGPLWTNMWASILEAQKEDRPLSGSSVLATAPLRLPLVCSRRCE